ncbi:hypothetical protein AB1Y20_020740 [Prymnesium parvum]|uniref:Coenzyme Q-binding protein COQ10 START domain-containing protein n=1 Tax=Prymnesium parvum TaxID=97485 RepID=A0AB34JY28_PRYPA
MAASSQASPSPALSVALLLCSPALAALHPGFLDSRHRPTSCSPRTSRSPPCAAVASADPPTDLPALPLPPLPVLEQEELLRLEAGERVFRQQPPEGGGTGFGFSVQEVCLSPRSAFEIVRDFDAYAERITTVRKATRYTSEVPGMQEELCYSFLVSRIRLVLNVRFNIDPAARRVAWQLDKRSWVLEDSSGYWLVEPVLNRPDMSRVWFCVSVRLNKRVPGFVVSLVSRYGLKKATSWIAEVPACDLDDA